MSYYDSVGKVNSESCLGGRLFLFGGDMKDEETKKKVSCGNKKCSYEKYGECTHPKPHINRFNKCHSFSGFDGWVKQNRGIRF